MRTYIPEAQECLPGIAAVLQTCQLCSMPCALGTSELLPSTCTAPSLLRSFPSSWPAVLSHAFPPKHTLSSNFYSSFSSHIKYSFGKAVHPFSPTDEAQRPLPGFLSQGGHSPTAQFGTVCASAGFWDEGHARHVPMALLQFLSPPCLARDPPPADARPIFVE